MKSFFPLVLDSTFLMEMDSCQMSGFRKYIQHLSKGSNESTDLVAGGAFAKGLEVARKAYYNLGADEHEATALGQAALLEAYGDHIPQKPLKTPERMSMALEMYFLEFPMSQDLVQPIKLENGEHAIEYSFAHELPFEHPDLPGEKLLITGRADMLVEYAGRIWVFDDKTTGSAFNKNWSAQWDTRGQFTTYAHYLKKDGIKVKGAYIRGVYLGKSQIKFQDCQTTRSDWQTDIWEVQMLQKVERILSQYKVWKESGESPANYFFGAWNESCDKYFRPCAFKHLCRTKNSEAYLEGEWDQNIWLPHEQKRENLEVFLESLGDN